jgi:hypothetical protein
MQGQTLRLGLATSVVPGGRRDEKPKLLLEVADEIALDLHPLRTHSHFSLF